MDSLQMEIDFTWMIEFCEKLTPYENFALIGHLVLNNYRMPVAFNTDSISEQTVKSSSTWLEKNFRNVLYFFCKHQEKKPVILAGTAIDYKKFDSWVGRDFFISACIRRGYYIRIF
jgi:hypothetical protein